MSEQKCIYVTHIGAPAERVWEALTRGEFTRRYFHATDVRSTWAAGAEVVYTLRGGMPAVKGRVIDAQFPRRLCVTWSPQYDPDMALEKPSRVTFELEEKNRVTQLTITHDDFPPASKVYLHVVNGWSAILCSLKSLLETGEPLPIAGNEPEEKAVQA
jgi:uncharacterized protein YndB with AHSA1/START domain